MRVNELIQSIECCQYPATPDQLVAALGDPKIVHHDGGECMSTILSRVDVDRFDCPDDAVLTVLSAFDVDAIGRRHYTDRDPPVPDELRELESV